ncbi:hypothetical protein, partial [Pseudomonas sp. NFACC37-1]|uniref:hypothetical protein n=1 Tax=Pseudomonas sp. NFACC37-1 TaxID=1566196 RepID=UPI001C448356
CSVSTWLSRLSKELSCSLICKPLHLNDPFAPSGASAASHHQAPASLAPTASPERNTSTTSIEPALGFNEAIGVRMGGGGGGFPPGRTERRHASQRVIPEW